MNAPSQIHADHDSGYEATRLMVLPLFCVTLLALFTITAPTSLLSDSYGTKSILPNDVIVAGKTFTRAITIVLMTGLLPFIWHLPERAAVVRYALPWFAFGAWGVVSTIWSPLPTISLGQSGGFSCLLLISLAIGILCRGIQDISRVLCWISCLLVFISAALIYLHFAHPEFNALTKWSLGIFHSTSACAAASLAITLLLAARLVWNFPWTRRLLIPAILLHGTVLVIGLSRTSIGVLLVLSLLIFMLYGNRLMVLLACTVLVLVGTAYVTLDPSLYLLTSSAKTTGTFLSQGQTTQDMATLTGRTEMWDAMWKSFLEARWIGHGYFVTSATGEIYVWHEWGNWTAHNLVLQLLVTTGIIGALLFAAGVVSMVYGLLRRVVLNRQARGAVGVCLLVGLWHTLFGLMGASILAAISPEACVFGCLLGIAFSVAAKSDESLVYQTDSRPPNSQAVRSDIVAEASAVPATKHT